jgi:Zn-finger nucleic acid-binding protein
MALRESPVCPKCGAAAPDAKVGVAYDCPFCGARSTLEPPAPVVQTTVVQPEVIRRVVVNAVTGETSLACPRCDVALFEGKAETSIVHGCGRCGGMWLDNMSSKRVLGAVQSSIPGLAQRAEKIATATVDTSAPARCPLDKNEMQRVTSYGIALDACAVHGTWFDAGEVKRLVIALQNERIATVASAGGATYDYGPAAAEALRNETYARGAFEALGLVLGVLGSASRR